MMLFIFLFACTIIGNGYQECESREQCQQDFDYHSTCVDGFCEYDTCANRFPIRFEYDLKNKGFCDVGKYYAYNDDETILLRLNIPEYENGSMPESLNEQLPNPAINLKLGTGKYMSNSPCENNGENFFYESSPAKGRISSYFQDGRNFVELQDVTFTETYVNPTTGDFKNPECLIQVKNFYWEFDI